MLNHQSSGVPYFPTNPLRALWIDWGPTNFHEFPPPMWSKPAISWSGCSSSALWMRAWTSWRASTGWGCGRPGMGITPLEGWPDDHARSQHTWPALTLGQTARLFESTRVDELKMRTRLQSCHPLHHVPMGVSENRTPLRTAMNHYKLLWTITNHYQPLWTITNYYEPLQTIMNHYEPLPTIMNHYKPLWTMVYHYVTLWANTNHYEPLLPSTNHD